MQQCSPISETEKRRLNCERTPLGKEQVLDRNTNKLRPAATR